MQTATQTATQTPSTELTVYTDPKQAPTVGAGQRMITARFRNPSRSATVLILDTAWMTMTAAVPAPYSALLGAVLETAAKTILSRRLENMSMWLSTIDSVLLTPDAILSEASGANTEWLTREELTAAWETSATRKAFISSPNYNANKAYRQAVDAFKELVLKLAGKTSQYQESELDKILVKLHEDDLETEFGGFVIKRVEALKNKPAKSAIDLDIL
jgi:hypothetical protein